QRGAMGSDWAYAAGQGGGSRPQRRRQPSVRERGFVGSAFRSLLAAPAGALWQVEERTRAFHPLGQGRRVGEGVRRTDQGSRQQIPDARHHSGSCPPAGRERKRGAKTQALGRSRGGLTTKIHMLCDGLGRPLRFMLTAGQRHDNLTAKALLEGFKAEAVLADRAYDNNDLRKTIADMDAEAVIPSTRSRKVPIPHDQAIYKLRNRIERCFNKLKHFRRFATRYDRRADYFLAFVHIAAICIWLR